MSVFIFVYPYALYPLVPSRAPKASVDSTLEMFCLVLWWLLPSLRTHYAFHPPVAYLCMPGEIQSTQPISLLPCLPAWHALVATPRFQRRVGMWSGPMPQHHPGLGQAFRKVLGWELTVGDWIERGGRVRCLKQKMERNPLPRPLVAMTVFSKACLDLTGCHSVPYRLLT